MVQAPKREKDLAAPKEIVDLVERFESNLASYKSGHYNETQVRREFVDPFFKALGWDIDNEQGFAEAYKDVIHEDAIRIGPPPKLLITLFVLAASVSSSWRPKSLPWTSKTISILPSSFAAMLGLRSCPYRFLPTLRSFLSMIAV